jgi:predicted nucleic acid-binding protein
MKVFADTFFFLALLDSSDVAHGRAVAWAGHPWTEIVTTEFVLMELGNALHRIGDREDFLKVLSLVKGASAYRVVEASGARFANAVARYSARMDKEWSLTDCDSMLEMTEMNLQRVLTADQHFAQAGFEILFL